MNPTEADGSLPAAPAPPAPAPRPFLWAPALVLWAVGVYVVWCSLGGHNFPAVAYFAQNSALTGLSWASLALAAALALIPAWRARAVDHLERLSSAPPRTHALWLAAAYGGLCLWLGFIRYCEYRGFLLAVDTAVSVNESYNFIRHGALYMSVFGVHPLSIHFNLLRQLLSPALLLWNSPLAVIFLEDALLFTAPLAVYCLAFSLTESSLAGFCGFWLALSTPYFYELLTSNVLVSAAAVLLPWALFFLGRRRWLPAGLLLLAMLVGTEAMPLTFFGLGLYFIVAPEGDEPRGATLGLAVCAASVAWWCAEMAVVHHFSRAAAVDFAEGYWALFNGMVPAGTPHARVPAELLTHPVRDVVVLLSSRFRFYHVLRVLFFMGFLCLAAPAATLPFWATVFPYILAAPTTPMPFLHYYPHLGYADFQMHEGAFMFAPLLWATAHGLRRVYGRLRPEGRQGWLLAWTLLIAGLGFNGAQRTLNPSWRPSWFDAMPRAIARIPPGARVWAEGYAASSVSSRRWLKVTGWGPSVPSGFESDLFKPDYVLFDKSFAQYAQPPYRDRVLTYLGRGGYRKIFDDSGVVLLEAPDRAAAPEDVPAEWTRLPPADAAEAEAYARYLLRDDSLIAPGAGAPPPPAEASGPEADNNNGSALAREGKLDEAIAMYKSALKARPDYPEALNNLGVALAAQGKTDAAILRYKAALRARPDYADAHNNLGVALAARGRREEAVRHFRRALALKPDFASARDNLQIVLQQLLPDR